MVISGGRDAAIDMANELAPVAKKVYLTYRGEYLKGHEAPITKLKNSGVACSFQTTITELRSQQDPTRIDEVTLTNHETFEQTKLEIDEVLINHGFDRDSSLLDNSDLPIELINDFYIPGDNNVPGLYAAGDKVTYDGKVHLILGAFNDAAKAVNSAKKYLEPEATEVAMVSSHNDIFKEKNKKLVQELLR